MPISDRFRSGLGVARLFALGAGLATPAAALEVTQPSSPAPVMLGNSRSVGEAFRSGMRHYNEGNKTGAVKALEYAAGKGHAMARWKLGRMYADGDGVPLDRLRAYEHFSKIADAYADENPGSPNARFVSNAFVALGSFYLDGIRDSYVKSDPGRAREMFAYAASYFGDPDAQYNVARLSLEGVGGPKDVKQAVRWFNLAAEKGHVQSQAMLGHLLFTGAAGMRQRARGLMWLTIAKDSADPQRDEWIVALHDEAMAAAGDNDRMAAASYLQQYAKK
jgi:TPR repeat protein